jgi:hypothetical protein
VPSSGAYDGRRRCRGLSSPLRGDSDLEFRLRPSLTTSFTLSASATLSASPPCPLSTALAGLSCSFSLSRFHINFLQHFPHRTTFTSADFPSPCSTYENGNSRVVRGTLSLGPSWCLQRVLPHVDSPAPERTSDSVRHRSAN